MLVQCPECKTKYNLNESQIAPEGSKVRCTRCKNVFTAFRPSSEEAVSSAASKASTRPEASSPNSRTSPTPEKQPVASDPMRASETKTASQTPSSWSLDDDLDLSVDTVTTAKAEAAANRAEPANGRTSFEDELDDLLAGKSSQAGAAASGSAPAPQEPSFEDELDALFAGKKDTAVQEPSKKNEVKGAESSFEDDLDQLFATAASKSIPVSKPAPASQSASLASFDDDVSDLFGKGAKSTAKPASSKDEMVADLEGAFQPPLIDKTTRRDALDEDVVSKSEKKSSRFGLIVTILVLLILATGAGIYVKFFLLQTHENATNSTTAEEVTDSAPASAAQIALENVRQYFVPNEKEGQLFIIEGKAVNRFPEAKELIRLKASLYDKQGQVVTSQEFMCGNVVTLYQLQVSSRQDIETALGAKVGILAHNTNVQPGASVPFMVVFFGTPETVEEFGLEVVQSQSPQ